MRNEGEFFESKTIVSSAHPGLGMGLPFRDLKPHFLTVLKGWLLRALTAQGR
jgi:hypothetical protein